MKPSIEQTWRVGSMAGSSFSEYLLLRRHQFAYEEASRRAPEGGVAADIACGLGYALGELGRHRSRMLVLDLAVAPLVEISKIDNVDRIRGEATRLPVADETIDLLVAFQLLEHVPRPAAVEILREVRRVLKRGGRGFLTTPNARWRLLPGQRPWNPFHEVEYGPRGIVKLCREAGIPKEAIKGVVGLHGAQELELLRVRQDPLRVYGGRAGARLRRALSALDRFASPPPRELARLEPEPERWFALSDDFAAGCDFWIEVSGR